jgi:putative sporulation protein YtaF
MLQGILFALALSLDGFGVGLSYGMRGIKIPFFPFVIICLSSAIAVSLSMFMGSLATKIIPPDFASTLGGVIMITVGVYISTQNFILNIIPDYKSYKIQLKNMGLVINILKEPAEADMDKSGIIDRKEAIVLGIALAMDAFGAGFAAAMSGYSLLYTPIFVALAKFILVSLGIFIGSYYSMENIKGQISLIPGGLILILGIRSLFTS